MQFHLFEHVNSDPCILELVPFDNNAELELEHIFVSRDLILPRIQSEVARRLEQKQVVLKPLREKAPNSPGGDSFSESDSLILEDVTNEVIGEFVLARTAVVLPEEIDDDGGPLQIRIKQTSSEMMDASKLNIVVSKPHGVSDPRVTRTRAPSAELFDTLLQSFYSQADDLRRASMTATNFREESVKAMEKFEVIKARPRAMSIDQLKDLELKHRGIVPMAQTMTAKERWQWTVRAIRAQKLDSIPGDVEPPPSHPTARRRRSARETFPTLGSLTPPNFARSSMSPLPREKVLSPPEAQCNTASARSLQLETPGRRSTSAAVVAKCKPPPRPSWNSSPARPKREDPLGGTTTDRRH